MSPQAEGEPRNDAGTGGDDDDLAGRVEELQQEVQELRVVVDQRDMLLRDFVALLVATTLTLSRSADRLFKKL